MKITDRAIPLDSIVVVIGANGYIALETCDKVLQAGYRVRGTVRDLERHSERLHKIFDAQWPGKFELVQVADFEAEGAFDEAFRGAAGVIYVSVPTIFNPEPTKVVDPLIKGLINTLKAASSAGVQRYVLNSSSKAADSADYTKPARKLTAGTFNHEAIKELREGPADASFGRIVTVYSAARALFEIAFWDWVKEHKPSFVANCIVPDGQFGRVLDMDIVKNGISTNGQLKSALQGDWQKLGLALAYISDVQDAARLMVAALASTPISNERIFSYSVSRTWNDMRNKARELYPDRPELVKGDDQDLPGRDLADASKPIARAEQILKDIGQPGFVSEDDIIRDFVAAMFP